MGYTPGPWIKKKHLPIFHFQGPKGWIIFNSLKDSTPFAFIERENDADLITAAPDLLEAAKGLFLILKMEIELKNIGGKAWNEAIEPLEKAIAKAEASLPTEGK